MNLGEERNYLKLQETLDALSLSERNRALAEEYLDPSQPENPELLKKAGRQDFSQLEKEPLKKTTAYVNHCQKRKREEDLKRFVRLMSAIGGSTAYYVLADYAWHLNSFKNYLAKEQMAAMEAEARAWNINTLKFQPLQSLFELGQKDPEALLRASRFCYHQYGNSSVVLTAIYLYYTKPAGGSGILKNLFGKNEAPEAAQAVKHLETELKDSISCMISGPSLTEDELKELFDFLEKDTLTGSVPANVTAILRAHTVSPYLLTLLGGGAYLGMAHSAKLRAFLRLCLAADYKQTLNACKGSLDARLYTEREEKLEKLLPISQLEYLMWCLEHGRAGAVKRLVQLAPGVVRRAAEQSEVEEYGFLMECIKEVSPKLYEELKLSYSDHVLEKTASDLVSPFSVGQAEAKAYLMGTGSLDSLYTYVNTWRGEQVYDYRHFQKIGQSLKGDPGFYRRAIVLEALRLQRYVLVNVILKREGNDWKNVGELVDAFDREGLPLSRQLEAYESVHEALYVDSQKTALLNKVVNHLAKRYGAYVEDLRLGAKNSTAIGRFLCIRVLDNNWQQEKETLLACAPDNSKMVRELLAAVYTSHRVWEPEVLTLLSSKKSQERELAVQVLRKWGAAQYQQELNEALEKEKSKKLQELLRACLGVEGETAPEEVGAKTPRELAAEILKGGKKRKAAWVFETPSTTVPLKDGSKAPEELLQALLVSYADMSIPGFSQEAAILASELSEEKLADFMAELFDKWLTGKAEAKKKWVLYAASIHGGSAIVPALYHQIQEWPQHARGAMAAEAVKALALNGSSEALLLVDNISRKFKFRQVKTAAGEALSYAAEQMGISKAELEDKIVPSLGFGEDVSRTFDYGTRTFTVYLTPALELEVFDAEQKKLKTLPAPGKRDEETQAAAAYADFKQLKKQLKTVVTNQKLRLEQALTAERLWKTDAWEALFVKNPVMHQFAIGLIWGVYENGVLKDTFRYMEDGSFNTVDEDEYELPTEGLIGLVHPVELEKETLKAWKEQLSDYEIVQPIPQLEREVFGVTEEEKKETELTRFGGKLLNGLSLSGKLQGMGWYRGSVQDAGVYSTFYREDGELGVELEFSGSFVGDENDDVTVYGASFYKAGTVKRGSYVYDTIKKENLYQLGEVNPRYFSEIVLQLKKATASSQEQLAYPECKQ